MRFQTNESLQCMWRSWIAHVVVNGCQLPRELRCGKAKITLRSYTTIVKRAAVNGRYNQTAYVRFSRLCDRSLTLPRAIMCGQVAMQCLPPQKHALERH